MALEVPELSSGNPQLQSAMVKITKAEQKPLDKIDERIGKIDNQMKLVKDLKGKFNEVRDAISPFKSVSDFRDLVGVSSHPDIVAASSIDKAQAKPGSYEFEVMNLATTNSVMTKGFPDKDRSEVGVGYISFETPDGRSQDIYINSDNDTLEGVANAINRARVGVTANVVNDGTDADNPWRLVIAGDKSGWKNDFHWPEFNFLDGDFDLDLDRIREARSAVIRFNGQPLMVDENNVKDLLPGVNIDLKRAQPGQVVKLEIKPDYEKIEGKAKSFVDKLNAVLTFIQNQNALTKDSRKDPTKALGGDVALQSIESRLRVLIQDTTNELDDAQVQRLRDMGIVFNRNGTLDFDGKKFQKQMETNFDEVSTFLSGATPLTGFARRVTELADGVSRSGDGMMSVREKNLSEAKDRLEKEKEMKTERAQKKLERAKLQFAKAEDAIQKLNSMSGVTNSIAGMSGR